MEKHIKMIYRLTVIALLGLMVLQGNWLYNQYVYTLRQYEDELSRALLDAIVADIDLRSKSRSKDIQIISQWQMNVKQRDGVEGKTDTEWGVCIYTVDKRQIKDTISLQRADSLSSLNVGVEKHFFLIKESNCQFDVQGAINLYTTNKLNPFSVEHLDLMLANRNLYASSVEVETRDSILWSPCVVRHTSLVNPVMEIIYPIDILRKEQIKVLYELRISPILGRMLGSLICSVMLFSLLVFCLIYQIKTLHKQQRIEELRRSFIKTMVHELKRPLSALKMSVSFMKNDKMMHDRSMREDIIQSSQNELDNLSSYFSKLRDMTCLEMEEIPLSFSVFNMKELIEGCIQKLNVPSDREVSIAARFDNDKTQIVADKMHINNIICNLLENAIKYSSGDVLINVDCCSVNNQYKVIVSDNGWGIDPAELSHIFEPYFRSVRVTGKGILGMGLGLSYVKLLIDAHKGKVSVESKLDKGTVFVVEIPKNNEEA